MSKFCESIIVGGGAIGFSIACELARAGHSCAVFDARGPGDGASSASLGIVNHPNPWRSPYSLFRREGHEYFRAFVKQLQAEVSLDFGFRETGALYPLFTERELGQAEREKMHANEVGLPCELFGPEEARALEPRLVDGICGALFYENDLQVNPHRFVKALAQAAQKRGAVTRSHCPVQRLLISNGRVTGILAEQREFRAHRVILAAGVWSKMLAAETGLELPLEPRKGQVVHLGAQPGFLNHIVNGLEIHIVPWPEGGVLIGATVEEAGLEQQVTKSGIEGLLTAALKLVPDCERLEVKDAWAGLRPYAARRGGPLLGPVRTVKNLIIATGHYKTGIQLAPITGRLVKELIVDRETSLSLEPFRPDR